MGLLAQWNTWRNACKFFSLGAGCELPASPIEVKGRVELGAHCVVRPNVVLRTHKQGRILLGDGCELSDYAMITSNARIEVGPNCYIGPHCVLRDINHVFQGTDVHWRLTPHITKSITVGAKCYLGARSYIMPGVTIGEGAVVLPGSIVTRDIGPYEVWAGTPSAQFIAHRYEPGRGPARKRHAELLQLFGFAPEVDAKAASAPDAEAKAPPKPKVKRPARKKAAAKKTASKPAKKKVVKKSAAGAGGADTPLAVKKALADAADVLKSLAADK